MVDFDSHPGQSLLSGCFAGGVQDVGIFGEMTSARDDGLSSGLWWRRHSRTLPLRGILCARFKPDTCISRSPTTLSFLADCLSFLLSVRHADVPVVNTP